jgi:hypothetical protein
MDYPTHELEFHERSASEQVNKVARRENKTQTEKDK